MTLLDRVHEHFSIIDAEVENKVTIAGAFMPSSTYDIESLMRTSQNLGVLNRDKPFLDAGSGDGRVVAVARAMGMSAFGVEADRELVQTSYLNMASIFGDAQESFVMGDFTAEETFKTIGIGFPEFGTVYNFANGLVGLARRMAKKSPAGTLLLLQDFADAEELALPGMLIVQQVSREISAGSRARGSLYILQRVDS